MPQNERFIDTPVGAFKTPEWIAEKFDKMSDIELMKYYLENSKTFIDPFAFQEMSDRKLIFTGDRTPDIENRLKSLETAGLAKRRDVLKTTFGENYKVYISEYTSPSKIKECIDSQTLPDDSFKNKQSLLYSLEIGDLYLNVILDDQRYMGYGIVALYDIGTNSGGCYIENDVLFDIDSVTDIELDMLRLLDSYVTENNLDYCKDYFDKSAGSEKKSVIKQIKQDNQSAERKNKEHEKRHKNEQER